MTTPTFTLPTSGSDPRKTTKEGLEENINSIVQYLDEARITGDEALVTGSRFSGRWNPSTETAFPDGRRNTVGNVQVGDWFEVSAAGTVDGVTFAKDDRLRAFIDNPSTTEFDGNWLQSDIDDRLILITDRVDAAIAVVDGYSDYLSVNSRLRAPSLTAKTLSASNPAIITAFGGVLYGKHNDKLYGKTTEAGPWTELADLPTTDTIVLMFPTSDDEVLIVTTTQVLKSSGWGGTVSWVVKVTNSGGSSTFLEYSGNGDGTKFVFGEYASGAPSSGWEDSVKAWATTDAGDTWSVIYDARTLYPSDYADTHIHGCAYDPVHDVFLVIEGHSISRGIYWSDDFGASWNKIEKGPLGEELSLGQPTCIVPTIGGIVLASDGFEQGLWVIDRGSFPEDMQVHWIWEYPSAKGEVAIFGKCWAVDENTGIVYVGFQHDDIADIENPLIIAASDGTSANLVWEGDDSTIPSGSANLMARLAVTPWGKLEGQTSGGVGVNKFEGQIVRRGGPDRSFGDTGGVLGGKRLELSRSVAVGGGARSAINSTAVGSLAKATGSDSTSVGADSVASGVQSVAVGAFCESGTSSVAVGRNLKTGANSLVLGASRDVSGLAGIVSLGTTQTVSNNNTVTIGNSAVNNGAAGLTLGTFANNAALGGLAVGNGAIVASSHAYSVALGNNVATTAAYQFQVGQKHIELEKPTSLPAGEVDAVRLYVNKNGSGKMEIRAQMPTGAAIILATEA